MSTSAIADALRRLQDDVPPAVLLWWTWWTFRILTCRRKGSQAGQALSNYGFNLEQLYLSLWKMLRATIVNPGTQAGRWVDFIRLNTGSPLV